MQAKGNNILIENKQSFVNSLMNIPELYNNGWLVGGGFSFFFFERNNKKHSLKMQFAPITLERDDEKDEYWPILYKRLGDVNYTNLIIERQLNNQRNFEDTKHGSQENEIFRSFNHFRFSANINEVYDLIKEKKHPSELSGSEINKFDLLFLINRDKTKEEVNVLKIPMPFLSTPTALIAIDDITSNKLERAKLINKIYKQTREVVYYHVYNKLISNLQSIIKDDKILRNNQDFIYKIIFELNKVLLPQSFEIKLNDNLIENQKFIDQWQVNYCKKTCNSTLELELKPDKDTAYKVIFYLTSFHFPVFKNNEPVIENGEVETQWIHDTPGYEQHKEQTKTMLENIFELVYEQWKRSKELKDKALEANLGKIINRNFSHHIGSHITYRSTVSEVVKRIGKTYIENVPLKIKSTHLMEDKLTFYKNDRNEYVSSVDEIGTPFAYNFYQDIVLPFIENSLIMDNIAKSEGVEWNKELTQSKLRVRVLVHKDIANGEPKDNNFLENDRTRYTLSLQDLGVAENQYIEQYAIYSGVINELNNELKVDKLPYFKQLKTNKDTLFYDSRILNVPDIEIFVPDALGSHAIYSILENQIRNVAKHGDKTAIQEADFFDIILKIDPLENDCASYHIEMTSNIPTLSEKDVNEDNKNSTLNKLKDKLKESLTEDVTAKGIADMRINANKLLFQDAMNLENHEQDPPVLSLSKLPKESKMSNEYKYSLNYKFCLKKTKRILCIDQSDAFGQISNEDFISFGIDYENKFDWNEFLKAQSHEVQYDFYEIAIIDAGIFEEFQEKPFDYAKNEAHPIDILLKKLPNKVLAFNIRPENERANDLLNQRRILELDSIDEVRKDKPIGFYESIWEKWIALKWQKKINVHLYFDKDERLTEKYSEVLDKVNSNNIQPILYFNDNGVKTKPEKIKDPLSKIHVFYDRHGKTARNDFKGKLDGQGQEQFKEDSKNLLNSWIYIDKNNKDFDLLSADELKFPFISFAKLAHNALQKVLIIDERAMENALNEIDTKAVISSKSLFGKEKYVQNQGLAARVVLPNRFKFKDIDEKKGDETNNNRLCAILDKKGIRFEGVIALNQHFVKSDDRMHNFDTLIIHRTILSKILEKDHNIFKVIHQQFPNILVCTGGGDLTYPDSIMARITRVSYSSVYKYFLHGAIMKNSVANFW